MSKIADSIRRGLQEAVAYSKGEADKSTYRVHVPERIDVKAIRTKPANTGPLLTGRQPCRAYNGKV